MGTIGRTLQVRVSDKEWWLENVPGELFDLDRFMGKKREAVANILETKHGLSPTLAKRIGKHVFYHEGKYGFLQQFVVGILLPSGILLGGTFDLDRDLAVLSSEIADTLTPVFKPEEYDLKEHVTEGTFSGDGRVLFKLYL